MARDFVGCQRRARSEPTLAAASPGSRLPQAELVFNAMKAHLKRHRDPLAKEPVGRAWGSGGLTLPCCCNPVVLVVKSRDSHKSVTASCQPRCTQLSGIALTAMVIEYVPLRCRRCRPTHFWPSTTRSPASRPRNAIGSLRSAARTTRTSTSTSRKACDCQKACYCRKLVIECRK